MKKALSYAKEFFHRADIFLLVMGLICATFGIIVISSATASYHSAKYVIVQSASLILGVVAFVAMTVLDVDVLADKWQILCAFKALFLLLLIPFGVSDNTGNTGWLRFFGIGIQPTEVVKLTFIVVLAKQISYLKEYHDLNSVWSVAQLAVHFVLLFGLILFVSSDLGSALIFFSIFLVMLFAAGFALHWFAIGFAARPTPASTGSRIRARSPSPPASGPVRGSATARRASPMPSPASTPTSSTPSSVRSSA